MLNGNMKKIVFDIDDTLLFTKGLEDGYKSFEVNTEVVDWMDENKDDWKFSALTARGTQSGFNFKEHTVNQVRHQACLPIGDIQFGKPDADWYVDDKGINVRNFNPTIECEKVIEKPWGKEYLLVKTDKYAMKRLEINPSCSMSKQYHDYKHETLHVVEGYGYAEINGKFQLISVGDTLDISPKVVHKIMASDKCWKLVIIEASTLELDDVVRLEEGK